MMQVEIEALSADLSSKQAQLQQAEEKIKHAPRTVYGRSQAKLEEVRTNAQKDKHSLKMEVEASQGEMSQLKKQLETAKEELSRLEAQERQQEGPTTPEHRDFQLQAQAVTKMQEEIEALTAEKTAGQRLRADLKAQLQIAQEEKQSAVAQLSAMKELAGGAPADQIVKQAHINTQAAESKASSLEKEYANRVARLAAEGEQLP